MARQFRSDDTSKWLEGFGNGSDGDLTISSNTTDSPIDASCSGTVGSYTLSATNPLFAAGQLILIHKSRGNTTTTCGSWELNKIVSYSPGTITLKYPLQFTYNDSGADQSQVMVMKQYNNVTVNNGVTWTAKSWNGNVGGIMAFFAKGKVSGVGNGTINISGNNGSASGISGQGGAVGIGYSGGGVYVINDGTAYSGEGSANAILQQQGANGSGGGGGYSVDGISGGGGGGHSASGQAGGRWGGGGSGSGGAGGGTSGNSGLTIMTFGGGGGGAARDWTPVQGGGAGGGGICLIIASLVDLTSLSINCNGGTGGHDGAVNGGGGGSGAGGSILIKSKVATLGTNKATAIGGPQTPGLQNSTGGAGAAGRIHLDYKTSYTGTTNPALDVRQDLTLKERLGGAFLFNFV